jgi:hypothetical protein
LNSPEASIREGRDGERCERSGMPNGGQAPHLGNVVLFPGGVFQFLAMDGEGTEICDWLTSRGITCVLLKYRVPRRNEY